MDAGSAADFLIQGYTQRMVSEHEGIKEKEAEDFKEK